jgi:hypothetical protein
MHLDGNYDCLLHFDNLFDFDCFRDDTLFDHFLWYFNLRLDYLFLNNFNKLYYFSLLDHRDDLLSDNLYRLVDWNFNVLDHLYFDYFLVENWYLNLLYYLYDLFYLNYLLHDSLDNFRHLHDFLNDTWYDHYLFDQLLYLHNIRHFHNCLDYLLYRNINFFYPFHNPWHFYYALNCHFHWSINIDIFEYGFMNLH